MPRVIYDGPAAGAWNMAVDEALLESAAGSGETTLRFYQWSQPTLSLGYFQRLDDRRRHEASRGCAVVRRATGGGAILHDRELTYSFTAPLDDRFASQATALYRLLHGTLIETLAAWGIAAEMFGDRPDDRAHDHAAESRFAFKTNRPSNAPSVGDPAGVTLGSRADSGQSPFLCFQRRAEFDLVCGTVKVAGSAQRRRKGGVLQHGSVLLQSSPSAPELAGLAEISAAETTAAEMASGGIAAGEVAARWAAVLGRKMETDFRAASLTADERKEASRLAASKYGSDDWTRRR